MQPKIICIPPGMIEAAWPQIGPILIRGQLAAMPDHKAALADMAELLEALGEGSAQCWVVIDDDAKQIVAAMISDITQDDDDRRVVFVSRMAGEGIAQWGKALSDRMVEFAKAEGCAAVMFYGRSGLAKVYSRVRAVGKHPSGVDLFERAVA